MDNFVQQQLRSCQCDQLIPLFRKKAYTEQSYKSLNLAQLMELIPDGEHHDDNVHAIFTNIRSLAIKAMKKEPGEIQCICIDDDDTEQEVEIIVEVKEEHMDRNSASPSENDSVPIRIEETWSERDGPANGIPMDQAASAPASEFSNRLELDYAGSGNSEVTANQRVRQLRKRPGASITPEPLPLSGRRSRRYPDTPDGVRRYLKEKCTDSNLNVQISFATHGFLKILFELSAMEELSCFAELLDSVPANKFADIHGLELISSSKVFFRQEQLQILTTLPVTLLSNLTKLTLDCAWHESIDPATITSFLSTCPKLQHLILKRGIFGDAESGGSNILIQIPTLLDLVTFDWAGDYYLECTVYTGAPPIINVDAPSKKKWIPLQFVVDFGATTYPSLKSIELGLLADMKFEAFSQFPRLQTFYVASSWNKFGFLRSTIEPSRQNVINDIDLPPGIAKSRFMASIPQWFPNLTRITINLPTVAGLRALVHHMSDTKLKQLTMTVNFVFESALSTALLDKPYVLDWNSPLSDKFLLGNLKKYSHWEKFADHLLLEIPLELDNGQQVNEPDDYVRKGIGNFKHLQNLSIRHMGKKIFLPDSDQNFHWNHPEVKVERWSSACAVFPTQVLLTELPKLRRTLRYLNLPHFTVGDDELKKFKAAMRFDVDFQIDDYKGKVDSFSEKLASRTGAAIKPEN